MWFLLHKQKQKKYSNLREKVSKNLLKMEKKNSLCNLSLKLALIVAGQRWGFQVKLQLAVSLFSIKPTIKMNYFPYAQKAIKKKAINKNTCKKIEPILTKRENIKQKLFIAEPKRNAKLR